MVKREQQEEGGADDSSSDGERGGSPCRITHHDAVQHLAALTRYMTEHVPGPDTVLLLRKVQKLLHRGMMNAVKQQTLPEFMVLQPKKRTLADQEREHEEDLKRAAAKGKEPGKRGEQSDSDEESDTPPSSHKRLRAEPDSATS
jgi:hypothetical protein